jgi:hypothetical protein
MEQVPELELLGRLGVLESFTTWFRNGLAVRDAWRNVFAREPVTAVLCGDDSNWYTRLPVLLARARGLPTVDFHHGAFDGRFLMKDLSSDVYLAKSEMERDYLVRVCHLAGDRVAVGAPLSKARTSADTAAPEHTDITFFSEPYENAGGRSEEVYRELLPRLCHVAQKNGRTVVVKLHPFENGGERSSLLDGILDAEQRALVSVACGPLTEELLARTWFGITVQSTAVADCAERGVPCFVCAWMADSPYGYIEQYVRFGIGLLLRSAREITGIPAMLSELGRVAPNRELGQSIAPATLSGLLAGYLPPVAARPTDWKRAQE